MRLSTLRPISQHSLGFQTRSGLKGFRIRNMASAAGIPPVGPTPSASELGIESINDIQTAPGVELNEHQRVLVGSVLDLFAGRPTLQKLGLWSETAKFEDPLTNAQGRKQYSAQWYGLGAVFNPITRLSNSVTSSDNPITLNLKTNYKLKGLGKETIIDSIVEITVGESGEDKGKIVMVKDKWNGSIPEGAIAKAFRNLNAVTVPVFVSVPKDEGAESKK